jgi:L-ascorbate metabolism protein UlaG (beta-lactamase superfamily)
MKYLFLCFAILIWFVNPTNADSIQVQYLGNEGFLIQVNGKKILIDALYGDGLEGYPVLPEKLRKRVEQAQEEFEDVNVVLASHHHSDHFDPKAVAEFLKNSSIAQFYSTNQAVEKLRAAANRKEMETRIHSAQPTDDKPISFESQGIKLTAYRLHHGKESSTENIGWLMEIGNARIWHWGDTVISEEEIISRKLALSDLDLIIVPFWYFVEPDWIKAFSQIATQHMIVMHVPDPEAPSDYFGDPGNHASLLQQIRSQEYKGMWIPTSTGEEKEIPFL